MSRLRSLLGRVLPGLRTFSDWLIVYDQIIASRPVKPKTLLNRRCNLQHLQAALGPRAIRSIRPLDVADVVREISATRPFTAQRVLIEAREVFGEAVAYGWVDTNPADAVRHLAAKVARRRLTLEQWQAIYQRTTVRGLPWVQHMLLLALITGQRRADLHKMRYDDVWDGYLHVDQQKTGARIALPVALRLDAIGISLEEAIESSRRYEPQGDYLLRKSTGQPPAVETMSYRFEDAFEATFGAWAGPGTQPTLHECRSLSERLYRAQGIDTQTLLGHARQSMTDRYNDDRGLAREAGVWKHLQI